MKLTTRQFGEIEIEDNKIIDFNEGLPGFPELHKFTLMENRDETPDVKGTFYWLQSVEDGDISFVLVDMNRFMPDYDPKVEEEQVAELGKFDAETFFVYNIAVVPPNVREMTVNLKAPVLINTSSQKGKQVICNNEEYTVRHTMFA